VYTQPKEKTLKMSMPMKEKRSMNLRKPGGNCTSNRLGNWMVI
jgi:hypothetical protein